MRKINIINAHKLMYQRRFNIIKRLKDKQEKTHPTRRMLNAGCVVDGEDFEIMLREENEDMFVDRVINELLEIIEPRKDKY